MNGNKLVIKDAARQLFGRIISALFGFVITKIISSYLGPLRYGDYNTILRYFARWTALVDFGIYVIAVKRLGAIKEELGGDSEELKSTYHKFVGTRIFMIIIIYTLAITTAYLIPAYTDNQFIIRALPLAMIYSASNMFVGIQQLPLQLFWKMNRLSRSLIIARFSQLAVLIPTVFWLFKDIDFSNEATTPIMILSFCLILFSVVASSIGQNVEVHLKTKDLLPFHIDIDRHFIKDILKSNWRYGFAYFFSSFHTLIVLMYIGWIFPTSAGYKYAGYRGLALSLVEILLIIPSSLGNSLLHKIPNYSITNKRKSMGNLLSLVTRIGGIIAIDFRVFAKEIINFVSSSEFLGSWNGYGNRGADQLLPFFGIVLLLCFIKQVFNYLFVSIDKQNVLFKINLIGIIIGIFTAIFVIPRWNLLGGVITQVLLEAMFTGGAICMAKKRKVLPILQKNPNIKLIGILIISLIVGMLIHQYLSSKEFSYISFFLIAGIYNILIVAVSIPSIKKVAHGLTREEGETGNETIN